MRKYLILLSLIGLCGANYIVNGDFEQPYTVGWVFDTLGYNCWVFQYTMLDPDPDYEVWVYMTGASGFAKLHQTVEVPTTNLDFSIHVKLYAHDNLAGYWAGAAVVLSYKNSSDLIVGETRICQKSAHCPWTSSPTLHLIENPDTLNWHDYAFNIDDELTNLPGVNPLEISKIQVSLFDTTIYC